MTDRVLPPPSPTPTGPGPAVHEAEAEAKRLTRRPMRFWDRWKFLWLFVLIFGFYVWRELASNPLMSAGDALRSVWLRLRVVEVLFVVEAVRQVHYLVSERSARWHGIVSESVFGRWDRWVDRRDPWTRYRTARLVKLVVFLAAIGIIFGSV